MTLRTVNVVSSSAIRVRDNTMPVNTRRIFIAMAILSATLAVAAAKDFPAFFDIAGKVGITLLNISGGPSKDYIVEANGNGAAFFDYDNDGDMDVLITNGSTLKNYKSGGDPMAALYENTGERFVDITQKAGITARGWGSGVCAADYDNDGNEDFYLTAYGRNILYRNTGKGAFVDVTSKANVGDARWGTNCAFADYDRDGDVDLYVANYMTFSDTTIPQRGKNEKCGYMGAPVFCGPQGYPGDADVLYRNNGDGTFADVTERAGIRDPGYYGYGVIFGDLDNDGWPDIYVANDGNPNFLFHNNRNGTFTETGLLSGTALNEAGRAQSGMGVSAADYDNDGLFDIFVTNFAGDTNTLYRNLGKLLFIDRTAPAGMGEVSLPYLGWGTGIEDFDNDGLRDIFVANGHVYPEVDALNIGQHYMQRKELYRNLGEGRFKEIAGDLDGDLLTPRAARGTAFADFDNDGDIDVLAVNLNDRPNLYRNESENGNHWITFRLEGVRSNRDAIGARIEIDAGGRMQAGEVRSGSSYLSHNDIRVHFGLGDSDRVDRVRVRWPNSPIQELTSLAADRVVTIREGQSAIGTQRKP
jgi:hypothetical protein